MKLRVRKYSMGYFLNKYIYIYIEKNNIFLYRLWCVFGNSFSHSFTFTIKESESKLGRAKCSKMHALVYINPVFFFFVFWCCFSCVCVLLLLLLFCFGFGFFRDVAIHIIALPTKLHYSNHNAFMVKKYRKWSF